MHIFTMAACLIGLFSVTVLCNVDHALLKMISYIHVTRMLTFILTEIKLHAFSQQIKFMKNKHDCVYFITKTKLYTSDSSICL